MLHKVFPDKEKAKSMFNMALERERSIFFLEKTKFTTIIAENYYEVIKEIATAVLLLNGVKAIGENAHKEVINSMKKHANLNDEEVSILQDLRLRRNKSMYEGKQINSSYLNNHKGNLLSIIKKLKKEFMKRT
ncbi:MAG: hypothetical protein HY428_00640 [Candidatus Levybacteria bacterium]|nr:hypothetical protein [Candidatus Levybacteria bacterium]